MLEIPQSEQSAAAAFMVNPHIVRLTLAEFVKRSGDSNALCSGLGFTTADLAKSSFRISYFQASHTIRRVLLILQDRHLGLHIGMNHHLMSLGLVGFGAMAAGTLRQAITFGLEFQLEAGSLLTLSMETHGHQTSIRADPRFADVGIEAHLVDGTFAAIVGAARNILGKSLKPDAVELVARKPRSDDLHSSYFQCPVRFGCARNRLVVGRAWDLANAQAGDVLTMKQIEYSLQGSTTFANAEDFELLIESRLRDKLCDPPTLSWFAEKLNMSERNLRRKLTHAGRSYLDMLDYVRKSRALELIAHSDKSSRDIAEEIGFSDARSLRRAFKRWTGQSVDSAIKSVAARHTGQ